VAESLQTFYQSSSSSQEVAFVEVMVADSQDGARHRNDGAFAATNRASRRNWACR